MKKLLTISMSFVALAILLGHSFVGHHHHELEPYPTYYNQAHNHDHDHQHHHDEEKAADFDLTHILAHLTLDVKDLASIGRYNFGVTNQKQQVSSIEYTKLPFAMEQYWDVYRGEPPPLIVQHIRSLQFIPSGLRAPPGFLA